MLKPSPSASAAQKQIALDSGKGSCEIHLEIKDTTSKANYLGKIQTNPVQDFELEKPMILAEVKIQEVSLERVFRVYFLPAKLK